MYTEREPITDDELERVARYAAALQAIENGESVTDADVERAERYALALERIENAEPITEEATMRLWISSALSPYGNEYGVIAVVAKTKDEAIEKAKAGLAAKRPNYVPAQRYVENLVEHLDGMRPVDGGVFIDWAPAERK
jgi:hypothetical protein